MEIERLMLLDKLTKRDHGTNGKKKTFFAKKNKRAFTIERNMEKRRNFVGFLFRKNKNRQKIASVEEHDPYKHMKRQAQAGRHREREKKKRLVEADDEEEAHYILYQKHIFKVNSQPKKKNFRMCVSSSSCRPNRISYSSHSSFIYAFS